MLKAAGGGDHLEQAAGDIDELPGGAINGGNPVYLRVLRRSADSTLSTIERLIERAAGVFKPLEIRFERPAEAE